MKPPMKPPEKIENKLNCVFCQKNTDNDELYGKKVTKENVTTHYFCMLFASGLSQRGKRETEGISGFLIKDIVKEVRRAKRLKCVFCGLIGATIGCVVSKCRVMFHFTCGLDNNVLCQYFGNFMSFCEEHQPKQEVLTPRNRLQFHGTANSTCCICMGAVEARASHSTLRPPCCKHAWFHRTCIQKAAFNAGLHFFKCPLCCNKDLFQQEMLTYGIHIPDQDASWELEPNAFQDLLHRHSCCDVKKCHCSKGRKYNRDDSKWEIVLCDYCGSKGTHMFCSNLKTPADDWVCPECDSITAALDSDKKKNKAKIKPVSSEKPNIRVPVQARKRKHSQSASRQKPAKRARKSDLIIADTSLPRVPTRRAWLKRNHGEDEQVICSADDMPLWYKNLIQADIFTGKNLGQKLANMPEQVLNKDSTSAGTSPLRQSQRFRELKIPVTPLPIGKRLHMKPTPNKGRRFQILSVMSKPGQSSRSHPRSANKASTTDVSPACRRILLGGSAAQSQDTHTTADQETNEFAQRLLEDALAESLQDPQLIASVEGSDLPAAHLRSLQDPCLIGRSASPVTRLRAVGLALSSPASVEKVRRSSTPSHTILPNCNSVLDSFSDSLYTADSTSITTDDIDTPRQDDFLLLSTSSAVKSFTFGNQKSPEKVSCIYAMRSSSKGSPRPSVSCTYTPSASLGSEVNDLQNASLESDMSESTLQRSSSSSRRKSQSSSIQHTPNMKLRSCPNTPPSSPCLSLLEYPTVSSDSFSPVAETESKEPSSSADDVTTPPEAQHTAVSQILSSSACNPEPCSPDPTSGFQLRSQSRTPILYGSPIVSTPKARVSLDYQDYLADFDVKDNTVTGFAPQASHSALENKPLVSPSDIPVSASTSVPPTKSNHKHHQKGRRKNRLTLTKKKKASLAEPVNVVKTKQHSILDFLKKNTIKHSPNSEDPEISFKDVSEEMKIHECVASSSNEITGHCSDDDYVYIADSDSDIEIVKVLPGRQPQCICRPAAPQIKLGNTSISSDDVQVMETLEEYTSSFCVDDTDMEVKFSVPASNTR